MENHICHTLNLMSFFSVTLTQFRVRRLWSWVPDFSHYSFHSTLASGVGKLNLHFSYSLESGILGMAQRGQGGSTCVRSGKQRSSKVPATLQLGSEVAGMGVCRGNSGGQTQGSGLVPAFGLKRHRGKDCGSSHRSFLTSGSLLGGESVLLNNRAGGSPGLRPNLPFQ